MKGRLRRRTSLFMGLGWATWSGIIYRGLREVFGKGFGGGVSPSKGALRREFGESDPLLGTIMLKRWTSLCIGAPLGNMEWGSSKRDFERWVKGSFSLCRVSLLRASREGSFARNPGRKVTKAPDTGISLHRGPFTSGGTWNQEGARIPGTLNDE